MFLFLMYLSERNKNRIKTKNKWHILLFINTYEFEIVIVFEFGISCQTIIVCKYIELYSICVIILGEEQAKKIVEFIK